MKYAWIDEMDERDLDWFSMSPACEVLGVSRSGFYDRRTRMGAPPTEAERRRAQLLAAFCVVPDASKGRYGSPRVFADLREQGWVVGENTVAAIMAANGIVGRSGRKQTPRTTRPAKVAPHVPDLVERDFAGVATEPDRLWCTDLTYVPTAQGWLYLVASTYDDRHDPRGLTSQCPLTRGNSSAAARISAGRTP